jgi:hypothetical protein
MDSLPPAPPAAYAPGDIYPRGAQEAELCASASHPDWLYLGGLAVFDTAAVAFGSEQRVIYATSLPLRLAGPAAIGLAWGATLGGGWLALPKCDSHWVGETPREGAVRAEWPVALSLAVLSGLTAPIVDAIAVGTCDQRQPWCGSGLPREWTTLEREAHVAVAAAFGMGGALLPYLLPPRTWAASRELDRLRFGADGRGAAFLRYETHF